MDISRAKMGVYVDKILLVESILGEQYGTL